MVLARPQIIRASLRAVGATARRPLQQAGRRTYASAQEGAGKSSDLPWMLGSVAFTVPAAFYLLTPAPTKISEHNHHGEMRMTETKKISETKEAEEGPEAPEDGTVGPDVKPSEIDVPTAKKPPQGANTMSSKQEGLDAADTDNPYINEPGKSVKGEGETDTAKLKGTVDPSRPQR
ncbi:hypothetical protein CNMCM5793_009022 [Aspergillus hiratsukae]|uniref:Uncharacterized protein n=1 Tax=Aspergillus hiratsukae TaxID=1194566 RepID=A0A8H6P8E2_9EURO|nr:hypothetical protein CNMCM5793_009022 [Aspergillus hiratsukae]KAF7159969.1 hypothetical protein CNMCM6106_007384 [Aspergillus hiratsukae]